MPKKITFHELTLLEPRLLTLLAEAQAHHWDRGESFCANAVFFSSRKRPSLKGKLLELVGWYAQGDGLLRTEQAYKVAYHTIYEALPDCRRCMCVAFERAMGREC
jgi:hypothetical protein